MAQTALSDLNFQSAVFKEAFSATFTDQLRILTQILTPLPDSVVSANEKGKFVSFPYFNPTSERMQQITSGGTLTPDKLTQRLDRAAWLEKEIAFASEQINMIVAGQDPTEEAAIQLGTVLAKEVQYATIAVLTGITTTALLNSHVLDDSSNTISETKLLEAKLKLGDRADDLRTFLGNSKVTGDMLTKKIAIEAGANVNAFESGMVGRALGMNVYSEDAFTANSGVYSSYLVAPGAVGYKFRNRPQQSYSSANVVRIQTPNGLIAEFEVSRSPLDSGGVDTLIMRSSFIVHPAGMQFTDATANPSDTDLATGSNWTKAASDNKLIKVVQYKSL